VVKVAQKYLFFYKAFAGKLLRRPLVDFSQHVLKHRDNKKPRRGNDRV
jgi:hypothetical protein